MTPLQRLLDSSVGRRATATSDRVRKVTQVEIAERTVRRFLADGMVDRAASLAYYGLLSLLPVLMIAAGVISLLGAESAATDFSGFLRDEGTSDSLAEAAESAVQTALDSAPGTAGTVGLVGLLTLIYGASRAFAAAGRALDVIWRRRRKGLTIVRRVVGIGWTLVLIVLGLVAGVLTFVGRGLAEDVLGLIGLDDVVGPVWTILRWPLAAVAMMFAMRLVMWAAPSPPRGRFTLVTPGSILGAGGWLAASAGYAFYVGALATYNATYGAFGALVILLLWIWLTSMVFLLSCEFDAVLVERRDRRIESGEEAPRAAPLSAAAAAGSPPRDGEPEPPPPAPARPHARQSGAEGR